MPRSKKHNVFVGEHVKIAVNLALKKFLLEDDVKELEFPSSLTAEERAYIHQLAEESGLKSKSRGKGASRYVTVYKKEGSTIVQADAAFSLSRTSRQQVITLIQKFPVSSKERQELLPLTERDRILNPEIRELNRTSGRLNNGIPLVPPIAPQNDIRNTNNSLPIMGVKDEILKNINSNQVTLIMGETGCGKTTQVPQFILDECSELQKPCRIVCTQPRRISVLAIADRVSLERDEKVGQTVGYQIRLESRVSPKTLLTYCTSGVLLRTLMGGDVCLSTVTHIIVDEVHERDRFADFLLIILRDCLNKYRNLKVVLMSASIEVQLFTTYFPRCVVMKIPGNAYPVEDLYLEDLLRLTQYTSPAMVNYLENLKQKERMINSLDEWTSKLKEEDNEGGPSSANESSSPLYQKSEAIDKTKLDPWLTSESDRLLEEAFLRGTDEAFSQLMNLIMSESSCMDHQHSQSSLTPLMVATCRGHLPSVDHLLSLGADASIKASNDMTALDWAIAMDKKEVQEVIEAYITITEAEAKSDYLIELKSLSNNSDDDKLLKTYLSCTDTDHVDYSLILDCIRFICETTSDGGILIFLPGYDDIVILRDMITSDEAYNECYLYSLFMLHSNMQTSDQKRVFKALPPEERKIILATNIAETSITVEDVQYVIDPGKVKEKSFCALTGASSLKTVWISKASSLQRRGRAGRTKPGYCYRLYSKFQHENMQKFPTPEILKSPIEELCLHTKLLAPPNTPIADFISRAPEVPSLTTIRQSVQLLKTIDALDPWEDLTELGHHLLDLPVSPKLAKTLLYSVVLKCLDPILTIICCLADRDIFMLPSQPHQKRAVVTVKKKFAAGTYSDHMVLLRAFQSWQKARSDGWEKAFCEKNFISSAAMEMVVSMRTHLLGQLRASGFVRARGGGDIRDLNMNSENWAVVKAALCAGMYPNLIRVDRENAQLRTQKESKVRFHPSSVLLECSKVTRGVFNHSSSVEALPTDWLVYEEMARVGRQAYARYCTVVTPITVALLAGPSRLPLDALIETDRGLRYDGSLEQGSDSEHEEQVEGQNTMLKLDDWTSFKVDLDAAHFALQLRQKWHSLFIRRMKTPSKPWSQVDESVVRTLINVLTCEEQNARLQQPTGIGQRPRPISSDFFAGSPSNGRKGSLETDISDDNQSVSSDPSSRPAARCFRQPNGELGTLNDISNITKAWSAGASDGFETGILHLNAVGSYDSRYFVIKAATTKSIEVSYSSSVWAFSPSTERKLIKALKDGKKVILIFSVQGSGQFQGYAQLTEECTTEVYPEINVGNIGKSYKIEWIKKKCLPFQAVRHLSNPYNDNRKVQTSRDGQELEPSVGDSLCKFWDKAAVSYPYNRCTPDTARLLTQITTNDFNNFKNIVPSHLPSGRPIRGFGYSQNLAQGAPGAYSSQSAAYNNQVGSSYNVYSRNLPRNSHNFSMK